jgi:hypothetical protein
MTGTNGRRRYQPRSSCLRRSGSFDRGLVLDLVRRGRGTLHPGEEEEEVGTWNLKRERDGTFLREPASDRQRTAGLNNFCTCTSVLLCGQLPTNNDVSTPLITRGKSQTPGGWYQRKLTIYT